MLFRSPITVQFKATNLSGTKQKPDETNQEKVVKALSDYFKTKDIGSTTTKTEIASEIRKVFGITLIDDTLKLIPQPWCRKADDNPEEVAASFVEQPILGDVFAYSKDLKVTGSITIILPAALAELEKQKVSTQVKNKLESYVAGLKPGADVVFADLKRIAAAIKPVIKVGLDAKSFQVTLEGTSVDRLPDNTQVKVEALEKAQLVITVNFLDSATFSLGIGG